MKKVYLLLFLLCCLQITSEATHAKGGFISIVKTEGLIVTFRFTGFQELNSQVQIGGGIFDFGDGHTAEEGLDIHKLPVGNEMEQLNFELTHAYSSPGHYTVSFSEENRNEGIINAAHHGVSTPFYVYMDFALDPFITNQFPTFNINSLLKAINGNTYHQAIHINESDRDLMFFSLTVPKRGPNAGVQNYDFSGMLIDPFTGNLDWDVPQVNGGGHHNIYLFAIEVSEFRQVNGSWRKLSSTILDFNIELQESTDENPVISGWEKRNCDEEQGFDLNLMGIDQEFEMFVDAEFLSLTTGEPLNQLNQLIIAKDTLLNIELGDDTPVGFNYAFFKLSNDKYSSSRNLFYTDNCEVVDEIQYLVTDIVDKNEISIYPNPSPGLIMVKRSNANLLKIISLDGQEILNQPLRNPVVSLDLRGQVNNGIYMAQFFDQENRCIGTKRIVIVE